MLTGENGIITQVTEAELKTKFASYQEKFDLELINKMIENTNETESDGEADNLIIGDKLDEYIKDIPEEYKDNFGIYNDELVFVGVPTDEEKKVLEELNIENFYTKSKIDMIEKEVINIDTKVPPEDGVWESNGTVLNLGTGTTYNTEKGCFEQKSGIGKAPYIITEPFALNYDESFTIEYTFKMDNITTYGSDIELMSLDGTTPIHEHILFYTNALTKERWFSMYSHSGGLLGGVPHRDKANAQSPLEIYEEPITLTLVYDKEENKVKQYINGVFNREATIVGNLTGTQNVTWANTRQSGSSFQTGIQGEVYYVGIYETKVSDEQLQRNHLEYSEKYK